MSNQHEIADPPSDVVSSVSFSPDGSQILVGSWDAHLHLYQRVADTGTFTLLSRFVTQGPVLDVCWGPDGRYICWVGLDQNVRVLELTANVASANQVVLSSHEKASNKIAYSPQHRILISTSWDCTMHIHSSDPPSVVRVQLPAKPFALSLSSDRAVVAMAERKVVVYDLSVLRQLVDEHANDEDYETIHQVQPWQERESSLKFMTRAIGCMPDGAGFATSSIEGRVGVEWFDAERNSRDKYAFKCHRQTSTTTDENGVEEEVDIVYPVNTLAFHPTNGTFATGGGDGAVALWDAKSKRRVRQIPKIGASVAAVDFSPDGKFLAIGVSPGFEDGVEEGEVDKALVKLVVRELGDGDVKAKAAK